MEKKFKVTLTYNLNSQRYKVTQIVGPDVLVQIYGGRNVRVGDMMTEDQTHLLGIKALLTTK